MANDGWLGTMWGGILALYIVKGAVEFFKLWWILGVAAQQPYDDGEEEYEE